MKASHPRLPQSSFRSPAPHTHTQWQSYGFFLQPDLWSELFWSSCSWRNSMKIDQSWLTWRLLGRYGSPKSRYSGLAHHKYLTRSASYSYRFPPIKNTLTHSHTFLKIAAHPVKTVADCDNDSIYMRTCRSPPLRNLRNRTFMKFIKKTEEEGERERAHVKNRGWARENPVTQLTRWIASHRIASHRIAKKKKTRQYVKSKESPSNRHKTKEKRDKNVERENMKKTDKWLSYPARQPSAISHQQTINTINPSHTPKPK